MSVCRIVVAFLSSENPAAGAALFHKTHRPSQPNEHRVADYAVF